jgi:hypothetical protein
MLLSAATPGVVGLMDPGAIVSEPPSPPVPGLLAVPVSDAVSFSVLPRTQGFGSAEQLADVLSDGFTGLIVKHSEMLVLVLAGSTEPGTSPLPE